MSITTNHPAAPGVRVRSAAALAVPGVLAFTVPLLGFLASLLLLPLAARVRSRLWPTTPPLVGLACGALAVVGLWLPAALAVASGGRLGSESTAWLIIPLCAPSGIALLVPAALAVATYLLGLAASVAVRTPWPWVVGAVAAPLAYWAASHWLVDFACVA